MSELARPTAAVSKTLAGSKPEAESQVTARAPEFRIYIHQACAVSHRPAPKTLGTYLPYRLSPACRAGAFAAHPRGALPQHLRGAFAAADRLLSSRHCPHRDYRTDDDDDQRPRHNIQLRGTPRSFEYFRLYWPTAPGFQALRGEYNGRPKLMLEHAAVMVELPSQPRDRCRAL